MLRGSRGKHGRNMAGRIVAVGECMVELSPAGADLLRQGFAGDTFNTAWYLRRKLPEAWQIDYLSAVGQDAISDQMLGFMQQAGIGVAHMARRADATVGMYLITLEHGERSFTYWRDRSAARHLADDPAVLAQGLAGAALIVYSGITLAILSEDRREQLIQSISEARARGARVAFDPNMRERLWPNRPTMRHWIEAAARRADIVLPSFDEETLVAGDPTSEATIARYRGMGVPMVVVKNGAGAIRAWDGAAHRFVPLQQRAVDSTAAGDSFNAGFLAALLQSCDMHDCLEQGAALAGQVIRKPGALVAVR